MQDYGTSPEYRSWLDGMPLWALYVLAVLYPIAWWKGWGPRQLATWIGFANARRPRRRGTRRRWW